MLDWLLISGMGVNVDMDVHVAGRIQHTTRHEHSLFEPDTTHGTRLSTNYCGGGKENDEEGKDDAHSEYRWMPTDICIRYAVSVTSQITRTIHE
jgi:hypothetical protein